MPDRSSGAGIEQEGVPGRGDAVIRPSTWYSIELQATTRSRSGAASPPRVDRKRRRTWSQDGDRHWVFRRQEHASTWSGSGELTPSSEPRAFCGEIARRPHASILARSVVRPIEGSSPHASRAREPVFDRSHRRRPDPRRRLEARLADHAAEHHRRAAGHRRPRRWSGNYVGYTGNAAIGVSWQIFLVVIVFITSLFTGMGVLVARFAGARRARQGEPDGLPGVPDGRSMLVLGVLAPARLLACRRPCWTWSTRRRRCRPRRCRTCASCSSSASAC